jgi:hypothetical protein
MDGKAEQLAVLGPPQDRTCPFPSIRLKQAPRAGRRAEAPGDCGWAVGVYETGFVLVRRVGLPGDDLGDRLAGGGQPPFPLARGLWPVMVGQESVPAERAVTVLGFEEPPAGLVDRQGRPVPPMAQ